MRTNRKTNRRGSAMIYATLGTFALAGVCALAVDWGRVQVTKTELQAAADAAARYAAAGLQNDIGGVSAAKGNAAAVVSQNKADGRTIVFDQASDVETGIWNFSQRRFTPTANLNLANSVRVTVRHIAARNSAVPMTFLSLLGRRSTDVQATSIAVVDFSASTGGAGMGRYEYFVPATSNPWLSGMPSGTKANQGNPHNNPDLAGTNYVDDGVSKLWDIGNAILDLTFTGRGNGSDDSNVDVSNNNWSQWGNYSTKKGSPIQAGSIAVTPGATMTFDGVNGGANNSSGGSKHSGDGNLGQIESNYKGAENGIADATMPINAVVGVFLTNAQPNQSSAPSALDFSTAESRNFTSLSPALKQPFFIGDGRTSNGEMQQFVVPTGATRLYIGTMDGYEWNNNVGGFFVTAHARGKIITVK